MKWLDSIADTIGPLGCFALLVFYAIAAGIFLATCGC